MSTENGQTALTWAELNLNDIDVEGTQERTEVPAGTYKFRLVGAKPNPYREGDTDIDLVITEGPQAKRHVFASLPAPSKYSWVPKAAALLVKRIGITQQPGEDLVDTLSRAAANGASPIYGTVEDNLYNDKTTGELKTGRPRFQFFSVTSAT